MSKARPPYRARRRVRTAARATATPPNGARNTTARLFHGPLRRSEVAALRWADIDFADGGDVGVTVRRSKANPTGERPDRRRLVGGCASAVRRLQAATAPEPGDPVVGLSVDQVNRRFAAACAAAGLEGRRTSYGGRVGLAIELTAPRRLHPCRPARWRLERRQHGGALRRFGRYARRCRQPIHALRTGYRVASSRTQGGRISFPSDGGQDATPKLQWWSIHRVAARPRRDSAAQSPDRRQMWSSTFLDKC